MIDSATLERLNQQNWEELLPKLFGYTIHILKRYKVRNKQEVLPKGNGYHDLVFQAITLVYEGKRTWDMERYPDCFAFLTTNVIQSLAWNLYKSANQHSVKEVVLINSNEDNEEEDKLQNQVADPTHFEETIHEKEFLQQAEQRIRLHDDRNQVLMTVFQNRLDGMTNRQIAHTLDINPSDVVNAVKRIKRLLKPLIN